MADAAQPVTVYKGDRSIQVAPDAIMAAAAKGWSTSKMAAQGDQQKVGLTSSYNPNTQNSNPLIRGLDSVGGMVLGTPSALYHNATDPETEEESKKYGKGFESKIGPVGRLIDRTAIQPALNAISDYSNPKTRPSWQQAKSVLPEALGQGVGAVAAGKIGDSAVKGTTSAIDKSVSRIKTGQYSDVLGELEKFRKTIKENPSKTQRITASKAHAALHERLNLEWDNLFKRLETQPTDALAVRKVLEPLVNKDPIVKKWLDDNIKESQSGQSVTAPMWPKLRQLSTHLNEIYADDAADTTLKGEVKIAHDALEDTLKAGADRQGMKQQYTRAYQLTRKVRNIEHHTALESTPLKVSPLWGLGGAAVGIAASGGMGISGELGSAFLGKMAGDVVGKMVTPKDRVRIPDKSRAGEAEVWKELGEKPPKGTGRKTIKKGEIHHYNQAVPQ